MRSMRPFAPLGRGRPGVVWHPVQVSFEGDLIRGGALTLQIPRGPAGPVGPIPGTDLPYYGMDPSDPKTYVRPYRPAAGMIGYLNFDGAQPNPAGGVQRGRPPGWLLKAARAVGKGGVAGSSGYNG
jgi:hypothetical protein